MSQCDGFFDYKDTFFVNQLLDLHLISKGTSINCFAGDL